MEFRRGSVMWQIILQIKFRSAFAQVNANLKKENTKEEDYLTCH